MGRQKLNKPRKDRRHGEGGLHQDVLDALDLLDPDPGKILDDSGALSNAMLRTLHDPAALALRTVYQLSGREKYYGAAYEKGLSEHHAIRLEALLIWVTQLSGAVARLQAQGYTATEEEMDEYIAEIKEKYPEKS